jgi:hypothetical protein
MLSLPFFVFSQEMNELNERRKRMQTRKIAFVSNSLEISPKQSESFWPIYNVYSSELKSIYLKKKKVRRNYVLNKQSMNDVELGLIIDSLFNLDQEYLDLKIKYVKQFSNIISNKQMFELYRIEEDFKKDLLRKIKKGGRKLPETENTKGFEEIEDLEQNDN